MSKVWNYKTHSCDEEFLFLEVHSKSKYKHKVNALEHRVKIGKLS